MAFQYKDLVSSVLPPARLGLWLDRPDAPECTDQTQLYPPPTCEEGTVVPGCQPAGSLCGETQNQCWETTRCEEYTVFPPCGASQCGDQTQRPGPDPGCESGYTRQEAEGRGYRAQTRRRAVTEVALLQEQLRHALEGGL